MLCDSRTVFFFHSGGRGGHESRTPDGVHTTHCPLSHGGGDAQLSLPAQVWTVN